MKIAKTLNKMDDAVFQLLTVRSVISEMVESKEGAILAAELMAQPLNTLTDCIERLMEKKA